MRNDESRMTTKSPMTRVEAPTPRPSTSSGLGIGLGARGPGEGGRCESWRALQGETPEPVLGLPLERADAILPANLLEGGEIVVLLLKPSPLFIVLGCLGHLAAIIAMAVLAWVLNLLGPRDAAALGVLLGAVRVIWQFLEWMSRIYVLTDRRVIRIMGVLRVQVFEAPLKQIQHTYLLFMIRERVFGLGSIGFATAGTGLVEAYWVMVARPLAVHRKVLQAISRYGNGG
jgi:Bacterial PH domain